MSLIISNIALHFLSKKEETGEVVLPAILHSFVLFKHALVNKVLIDLKLPVQSIPTRYLEDSLKRNSSSV